MSPLTSSKLGLSLSVVLPAYNEEALIEQTILQIHYVVSNLVDDFEIIVTNDGSRDQTGAVLASLADRYPTLPLHVVTHERNRGYGAALASGFDAANKDWIFFTDGDSQFDVADLASFLAVLDEQTDLVIGWRRRRADTRIRLLNARLWNQLIRWLFGYTARDVDCAFKLFRREVWKSISVRSRGATFSAEFLIRARRQGYRVKELPVSHFPRAAGSATGANPRVIARAIKELLVLRWSMRRAPRHLARPRKITRRSPPTKHACGPGPTGTRRK